MAIRNDTDDNLVAEWQGVEVPNELQAPAHERAALLVRDGKLVTGLSTEPGLFVTNLAPSAKLQEDELQELLGERIASVYRREMLAVAGFSDPAIGGFPGGSAAHYWDRIRDDFASMSQCVLFERGDAAIKHAVRNLGGDQLDGFVRLLLILSALRLDGRLDEWTIRGFLNYHVANADYPVWRTIAMELLEPLTLAQTADIRMERRRLLEEIQLVRYRLAHLENYANYKEARCLMWPHMKQLRKDLRQIYGTRK